jgi:hypothetical protein
MKIEKLKAQKVFLDIVQTYIKENKGLYDNNFISHIIYANETVLNALDEQWEDKIKLYFSKISGSDWEAKAKFKEFIEIMKA